MYSSSGGTLAVGVFDDGRKARECVAELRRANFREDEIGVAGKATDALVGEQHADPISTGAATGAAAGAGVGALWALGIAAGLLPAIGPIIAGGILGSLLASAAGGAAAGGLVGALIGLGLPEEEAKYYESEFHAGRTIVTVKAEDRYDEAREIMAHHGAYDMHGRPHVTTPVVAAEPRVDTSTTGVAFDPTARRPQGTFR